MVVQDPKTRLKRMKIWAPMIATISKATGEDKNKVMSLMWRESLCGFAPGYSPKGNPIGWGDGGHAFGLFQIDDRYHLSFILRELGLAAYSEHKGKPYSPEGQAFYACSLLREAREWFKRNNAYTLTGETLERAVYASYNTGIGDVNRSILGRGNKPILDVIDLHTAGQNYSSYVFTLAKALDGLLW